MQRTIEIAFNDSVIEAKLNETRTAKKIIKALPIQAEANIWGSEVYFEIGIDAELENGKELMEIGNIAFWPSGSAFCIFFGPTPVGDGTQARAVSPVTVIGRITGDNGIEKLKGIKEKDTLEIRLKK